MPGEGEGDAEGVEAAEEEIRGDLGVLYPVFGVSPVFLKGFRRKYLDPSVHRTLSTRSGSGSTSGLFDHDLRELESEGTGK